MNWPFGRQNLSLHVPARASGCALVMFIHAVNDYHRANRLHLPRLAGPSLAARLRAMPAAVVTGARQTGKSTLAGDKTLGDRHVG